MAPEQLRDTPVNAQTDVYAASVVLWELLTGQALFRASNDAAVVARVLEGVVAPPSKLAPSLPPELDALVLRGLAKEAEDRFASAEEMAEALEALTQSTTARQVGAWVGHVAGDVIRQRNEQIARIEGSPSTPGLVVAAAAVDPITATSTLEASLPDAKTEVRVPIAAAAGTEKPRRGPRRSLALVLGAAVVAVIAGVAFVGARVWNPPPGATPSSQATPVDTPPVADVPAASATEEPSTAPISSSSGPTPPASAAAPKSGRSKPSATTKPNCTPPYYEDPSGIRRVKSQCL